MAKINVTVEGDSIDELKENLQEVLAGLGGETPDEVEEKPAKSSKGKRSSKKDEDEEEDLDGGDDSGDDDTEDSDTEDGEDFDALREAIKKKVQMLSKKDGGADKVRAAYKKVKAQRLQDVADEKLSIVAKALGVSV